MQVSRAANRVFHSLLVFFSSVSLCAQDGALALMESDFLTRIQRLTYDGLRAGEGYFSPDGSKLVFQSERDPENPFYQIFELDLESGETRRISPGYGKTTCAFVQIGSGHRRLF